MPLALSSNPRDPRNRGRLHKSACPSGRLCHSGLLPGCHSLHAEIRRVRRRGRELRPSPYPLGRSPLDARGCCRPPFIYAPPTPLTNPPSDRFQISSENNKDLQRKPRKVLGKVPRYNHHRNVFYRFSLCNSSPPSSASGTKEVICDAGLPRHLLYFNHASTYHGLWCFIRCHDLKGAVEM